MFTSCMNVLQNSSVLSDLQFVFLGFLFYMLLLLVIWGFLTLYLDHIHPLYFSLTLLSSILHVLTSPNFMSSFFEDNHMQIPVALFLLYSSHGLISVWWHSVWSRTFRKKKLYNLFFQSVLVISPAFEYYHHACFLIVHQIACWKTPTQLLRSIL